jgi:hypothetical protein
MDRSRALALVLRFSGVAFIVVFTLLLLASVTQTDTPEYLYRLFAWGDIGDAEEQMLAAVHIVWGPMSGPQRARLYGIGSSSTSPSRQTSLVPR